MSEERSAVWFRLKRGEQRIACDQDAEMESIIGFEPVSRQPRGIANLALAGDRINH
jgi:hypothetical protein